MGTEPSFARSRTDNNFASATCPVDNSGFAMNLSPGLLLDDERPEMQQRLA